MRISFFLSLFGQSKPHALPASANKRQESPADMLGLGRRCAPWRKALCCASCRRAVWSVDSLPANSTNASTLLRVVSASHTESKVEPIGLVSDTTPHAVALAACMVAAIAASVALEAPDISTSVNVDDNQPAVVKPQANRATCYDAVDPLLFPPIEPYKTGRLQVSKLHSLYYEECGNPNGKPVLIVHGGPGGGCDANMRQYHDPAVYRIILLDQRGSGRSTPWASLEENTTWHLIDDMEKLRRHLHIDKWQVFGGSWGSTLSIAYAINHPSHVSELILRGIFLFRQQETAFYSQYGAHFFYPDCWEPFRDAIPEEERGDFIEAYHKRLISDDPNVRIPAALAWTTWERTTSKFIPRPNARERSMKDTKFAEAFARIESHYSHHKGFFPSDEYLLDNADKIRHIPTVIVQGRYDVVCPMKSAWDFHKAVPQADLRIVATAGHSAGEPCIAQELVDATNRFKHVSSH